MTYITPQAASRCPLDNLSQKNNTSLGRICDEAEVGLFAGNGEKADGK